MTKTEIRCPHCGRLLFKVRVVPQQQQLVMVIDSEDGDMEIKCDRCKAIVSTRIAAEYRESSLESRKANSQRRFSDGGLCRS